MVVLIWACSRLVTTFSKILEKLTQVGYNTVIFQFVFRKICGLEILRKCTSVHWNVNYVSVGVINMSRQFFNTLVEMVSRSHDFDDELKISFFISSSDAFSKPFGLYLISVFCTCGIFCTSSGNLEWRFSILSTKYLEKWPLSDFTNVNSGRAGGGILCWMY